MKRAWYRLCDFFQWLNRNWNPRYLRRQNLALQRYIDKLGGIPDEASARAMLMQLRVHQESVRHRDCPTTIPKILLPRCICANVRRSLRYIGKRFST